MKKEDAEKVLQQKIKDNTQHPDYDKVVKYSDLMKQLITGDGIEKLLVRYVRRETEQEFNQRVTLTQLITPAICNAIISPAYKIPKVKPTVDDVDFNADKENPESGEKVQLDNKAKKKKLTEALKSYNGGAGVSGWQEQRFIPMSYLDPNAFEIVTFGKFDNRFETAKPYPLIASSREAIWFDITDNTLYWLMLRNNIIYQQTYSVDKEANTATRETEGKVYQFYYDNGVIEYKQTDETPYATVPDMTKIDATTFKVDATRVFTVTYYTPKTGGKIQAKRIGYKLDETTNGRTCVSPLHPAMPYLMKSIKLCSELDISVTLHTFLQKLAYQPKCKGESNTISCDNGYAPDGKICKKCNGLGYIVHESSQDAIYLTLPRNPDDAFDLAKLMHYQDIPIDILKFLKEHLGDTKDDAIAAVYLGESLVQQSIQKTATEKFYDMQNVYDALYPLAQQDAAFRMFQTELIAGMIDLIGTVAEYAYPKDFKMRGLEELLNILKLANDSGASIEVRQEISADIAAMVFQDRPQELKRIEVKQMFNPYNGKTEAEIGLALSNPFTPKRDKVLWTCAARIFNELEQESLLSETGVWFYDKAYKDQKADVDKKVVDIMAEIETDEPAPVAFNAQGIPADATTDTGAGGTGAPPAPPANS